MASNLIAASGEPAFPPHVDVAHNPPPYDGQSHSTEKPLPPAPNGGAPPFPEPSVPRAPHEAAPSFPEPSVPGAIPSAGAAGDAASTRSGYSAAFSALPADPSADLNTTAPTPADVEIPAVLFGIPFPAPLHADASAKKEARRPALLLYAPPRAPYRKPPAGEDGKVGKQKLVKRVERKWQEEVEEAKRLHEGAVPDASRWKKMKAPLARKADQLIQWLPDSTMSAMQRIPPKKRMKHAVVFVPADGDFDTPEKQAALEAQLQSERKGAVKRTWISGLLLPVTEAIDFFNPVPIFAFEVNLAYFAYQLQGLRKATALTSDAVDLTLEPSPHLEPLRARLAALCNARDQAKFPDVSVAGAGAVSTSTNAGTPEANGMGRRPDAADAVADTDDDTDSDPDETWGAVPGGAPPLGRAGGRALADAVVAQFRAAVPPAVAARHALDDLDALAADVERCLRKGVREYLKTV